MNIGYHGFLEMIKASYNNGKERKEGKEQMESDGWIIQNEQLIDNKVYVTFIREIEIVEN